MYLTVGNKSAGTIEGLLLSQTFAEEPSVCRSNTLGHMWHHRRTTLIRTKQGTSSKAQSGESHYNYALGYLRGFLVLLVVAHHAMLAYHPFAPPLPKSLIANPRWWQAFPVIDSRRWAPAYLLVDFNERFFMALMFLLSGLFVWRGLLRKGSAAYLRQRLKRLGVPFLLASAFLAPIAYYPTYLQMKNHAGIAGFWSQWSSLGQWPSGPAWFLWVLLAFDCVAALLFMLFPRLGDQVISAPWTRLRQPLWLFLALVGVSLVAYVPLTLLVTPARWTALGPFNFQTSRILLYLSYFLSGTLIGAYGLERGVLAPQSGISKRWQWWVVLALGAYSAALDTSLITLKAHAHQQTWAIAVDTGLVVSCAASSVAFLSIFIRFLQVRVRPLDSLSENSYGIYLVHYGFVTWLQYLLLPTGLPASAKFAIVFVGALTCSCVASSLMKRVPLVARFI